MKFTVLSTTAKHNTEFLQLPDRIILSNQSSNFLISSKMKLDEFLSGLDKDEIIIADCESKQGVSLYNEALDTSFTVLDYKPNDLTMEAADLAILNYFKRDLRGKSIAIYGTGNIASKLALRLSERSAKVYMFGRNPKKISVCVEALKQITFEPDLICYGDSDSRVDCLVSFVSSEKVIGKSYLEILNDNALCLDGGIGNFSKGFIKRALESNHEVRRLDVRQSQEIMDGYINSRLNSEFDNIIGTDTINGEIVVAGGIMGRDGEIIIDRISKPTRVIGVANGIGGVKNDSELSDEEKEKIKNVQEAIEQSFKKSVGR
ncbi:hypothetical protein [Salinicoccus kekensis]|uniref:Uncharacterized protein n=1 Tax=Salinicoccus kekensis TaxID=714307 RepID=A0A285US67_9STAP|nr:hypothetical protein [Salinicoccus kekensis]SOC44704.1 hypothetical protein SAMN05878391_2442 [Salinicoccus kekensis]